MKEVIGLYQLNCLVKQAIKERFSTTMLITAEIADLRENRSGHCYLELVEKREGDEAVIATARATIWSFTYRVLKPYFETTTGRRLEKGIKVLVSIEVVFHELYGYSLNIKDIDPTFTIGDLERKKREIIERLTKEGVIDINRELVFPLLPKSIAIISSPTAAGYGDFVDQLHNNPYGYQFYTALFPAVMQGDRTTTSIIEALDKINSYDDLFDVVVLIRGGGSQTDLGSFDSYELAANIAQFPLPIIAGIGHERDETIVDRVAHKAVKTPTAAAAFLIESFSNAEADLDALSDRMIKSAGELLQEEREQHLLLISSFKQLTNSLLERQKSGFLLLGQQLEGASHRYFQESAHRFSQIATRLHGSFTIYFDRKQYVAEEYQKRLQKEVERLLVKERHVIDLAEAKVKLVDPKNVLERGYSITRIDGRIVRNPQNLKSGDLLTTTLFKGEIKSRVE